MSRRGFSTGLSDSRSNSTSKSDSNFNSNVSAQSQTKSFSRKQSSASAGGTISPPDPEHAILHVPTHTTAEKAEMAVNKGEPTETPAEVDEDVCFICAEPITFWSVGVCGHRTCHICAVRLRTFYKKNDCTFCKAPLPSLLFSRSPTAPFPNEHHLPSTPANVIAAAQAKAEKAKQPDKNRKWDAGLTHPGTLDLAAFPHADEILSVVFEDEDMMEATLTLLRYNCPYQDCPYQGESWVSLERHTLSTHGLVLCTQCRTQLSRFAHEQGLYPPHLLGLHDPSVLKRGQRPPKPRGEQIEMVKTWDAPHPMCEFCHKAFFGPDELFVHMRRDHEECHVCKGLGDRDVYFQNYDRLEEHFKQDHFPCAQPICLEKKFVVFGTDMDLKAHMVAEHSEAMSARDRASARQVAVDFSSHDQARQSAAPRGSRSGRGQGFTLAQPFNASSGGPSRIREAPSHQQLEQPNLTPAQHAQQQRQVQKDKQEDNRRKKAFATGLTRPEGSGPSGDRNDGRNRSGFATPREDVDEATATRHAELLSRVAMLVNDSETKLSAFRSAIRSFKNNESTSKDMLDTVFHVFDRDVDVTAGIVREVASLFSGEGQGEKERNVLEALNAFRVEQRDQFPSLANNTPRGLGGNYAGIASGTVLNAKRTTQSGGSRNSRSVWDRVEAAAASHPVNRPAVKGANGRVVPGSGISLSSAFPSLSGPSAGPSSSAAGTNTAHSLPWAGGGAGSKSKTPSALAGPQIRSINFPTASASKAKPINTAAFPSLPTSTNRGLSATEKKTLFAKPTAREESIRRITGQGPAPPISGWNGGSGVDNGMADLNISDGASGNANGHSHATGGGGKKKGKGKQLLFSVSARP